MDVRPLVGTLLVLLCGAATGMALAIHATPAPPVLPAGTPRPAASLEGSAGAVPLPAEVGAGSSANDAGSSEVTAAGSHPLDGG